MDVGRPSTGYRVTSARPPTSHYQRGSTATRAPSEVSNNRIDTAIGYAGNVMLSERPITQHGLSGLSTAQVRQGTAVGMRQIKDKRYWQSQLQMKMNEIIRETDKLSKEREAMNREKSAKRSFEKRVQESTKELTILQSKLSGINIVLDSHSSGLTRQQLQQETLVLREQNEAVQSQLEGLFHQRQIHQQMNQELQAAIQAERNTIHEMVFELSPEDQQKYHQLQASAEQYRSQMADAHGQVETVTRTLNKLQSTVSSSQPLTEAARLLSKLKELLNKRNALQLEEAKRLTPAQEREKLIAEVRQNNATLVSLNNQLKIVEVQLNDKRELLAQTNQDLEEGQSDRHIKYRELKRRDETMSEFMETFSQNMALEKENIDLLKNQITYGIEQITLQGINLKAYGVSKAAIIGEENDLGSQDGLVREYKRLSIQLKQLQILEKRTQTQLNELRQDEQQYEKDIAQFSNHNLIREEATEKMDMLSATIEELQKKKLSTLSVVAEARKRNKDIKTELSGNEHYKQISHIEEKISDLIRENNSLQDYLDQAKQKFDYTELKQRVEEQLSDLMRELRKDQYL